MRCTLCDKEIPKTPWQSDGYPFCDKDCQQEQWLRAVGKTCTDCSVDKCKAKENLDHAVFLLYRALALACKNHETK